MAKCNQMTFLPFKGLMNALQCFAAQFNVQIAVLNYIWNKAKMHRSSKS